MELLGGMREKRIEIIITCLSHVHIFTPLWCLHFMFDEPKESEGARACTYAKQKKMILIEFEMMFFATYFQFRFILPHTYIALEWIVVSVICVAVLHPFLWIFYASNCYFRWKEEEEGERKKNTRQTVKNNSANNIHRYTQYTFHFDAINQSGTYHPIDDDNKCVFFFCSLPSPCYVFFLPLLLSSDDVFAELPYRFHQKHDSNGNKRTKTRHLTFIQKASEREKIAGMLNLERDFQFVYMYVARHCHVYLECVGSCRLLKNVISTIINKKCKNAWISPRDLCVASIVCTSQG